ncbi:TPA: hypothetical protein DIV55_05775 [Patescibacteria group bacterium]|uniref:Nucleotidyl transferase AbiEii/AbiGii toxin family protein n=1 Tax=Candidatus Gottesmanbacteria bacterium GW2011_GWA1_43_11 TaxID=1618436 RepID=A0A0G1CII3_9BACT|nr:MAG: hypothetical protein UV59_C0006G0051 [Candidatus Gottesmanbacteria bacterium GW2011_GWA1_43_11]HCS79216.1 hypothetical protein [Patescibacteria group bacterium]
MGKTILTPKQHHFLELISTDQEITRNFYLTGGTALAEFYYQHRLSEDIDLFCETQEVDAEVVDAFLKRIGPLPHVPHIKRSQFMGLVSYLLTYADGSELKVDFNYYPFPRIEKGTTYKTLSVDSVYDIAVNKVHTMFMKARSRDFIDLYFILTKENYSIDRLILDAKAKFDWDIDRTTLASQFLRSSEFPETPTMLVPFDPKAMEEFFLKLAKSLKADIFVP